MSAHKRLVAAALVMLCITAYMVYLGASASWQYYLTVDESLANAASLLGTRVRVSGRVSPNTLRIADDRRKAAFSIHGSEGDLAVICSGPLPDNLAEGIDVVVEGRMEEAGLLNGRKVITRCASKYESQATHQPTPTAARPGTEVRR